MQSKLLNSHHHLVQMKSDIILWQCQSYFTCLNIKKQTAVLRVHLTDTGILPPLLHDYPCVIEESSWIWINISHDCANICDVIKHFSVHEALEIQYSTLQNFFEAVQTNGVVLKTENRELENKNQLLQADLEKSKQSKYLITHFHHQP